MAQFIASKIFAAAGVMIDWRFGRARSPGRSITIDLEGAPRRSQPHALAYALPYEGVHIGVFCDRIEEEPNRPAVLAHVLVHEITHILQGSSGIQKRE